MSCITQPVPIFPLPNCVVLPGVFQALHVFEPRYRQMVGDALKKPPSQRWLAIALLKRGYESSYYTHHAPIHPQVCLCTVVKSQLLGDGRSNLLIQGRHRALVQCEQYDASYRCGTVKIAATVNDLLPEEETSLRRKLADTLQRLPEKLLQLSCDVTARENDLERVVDMISYHILGTEAVPAKQMILAEPRIDFRVKMLITLLERQHLRKTVACSATWPPEMCGN